MFKRTLLAALLACALSAQSALADYRITFDGGGLIAEFIDKYVLFRTSGVKVVIDGMCLSACAMVTSIPADRVCVTPSAVLGFHSATDRHGEYNLQSTGVVWHFFPQAIRALVEAKGWDGLSEHADFVYLEFDELKTIYRVCE